MGSATSERRPRKPTIPRHRHADFAGRRRRLPPSPALAGRSTPLLPDELGAVIALEAETGADAMGGDLSSTGNEPVRATTDRDLNPAVVHDGLVIVAPSDACAIYAFDAESGRLVWKTEPVAEEVRLAHLLGVAKGRLVATGDRVLLFDVKDGRLTAIWPDIGKVGGIRSRAAGRRQDLLAHERPHRGPRSGLRPPRRAADQADGNLPQHRRQPRGR